MVSGQHHIKDVVIVDFSQNFCSYQKTWALMSFWE